MLSSKSMNAIAYRPLKVDFSSLFDKRLFLSKLYKLKYAAEPFKNISVQHDMSLEERAASKELAKKVKDLNKENQNLNIRYKIKGPPWDLKIVSVQTKSV